MTKWYVGWDNIEYALDDADRRADEREQTVNTDEERDPEAERQATYDEYDDGPCCRTCGAHLSIEGHAPNCEQLPELDAWPDAWPDEGEDEGVPDPDLGEVDLAGFDEDEDEDEDDPEVFENFAEPEDDYEGGDDFDPYSGCDIFDRNEGEGE